MQKKNSKGDILISRFSALGDVAMTLPAIYDACMAHPERRFIMLTRKHPAGVFINPPENLVVHAVDTDLYPGVNGMRKLYAELKREYNITHYADFHDVLRTKLLRLFARLDGVMVTHVDKDRAGRRRLTRRKGKQLRPLTPMVVRYEETLRRLGVGGGHTFKSIFRGFPDAKIFVEATVPKRPDEKWIGVAPFAQHQGKVYPPELMQSVILQLLSRSDTKIFVFGFGKEESEIVEYWRRVWKAGGNIPSPNNPNEAEDSRLVNMARMRLGIPAELALIAHCDVMLTMDSANLHFAGLTATPAISVWGATHPYCGFLPPHTPPENVVQMDLPCRPCSTFGNKPCFRKDFLCMQGISPVTIAEAVLAQISSCKAT